MTIELPAGLLVNGKTGLLEIHVTANDPVYERVVSLRVPTFDVEWLEKISESDRWRVARLMLWAITKPAG